MKRQVALPVIGARIMAYDPSLWSRCALIDQGKAQGVKNGLPVLAPEGIVGRVVETFPQYSKVMLIVDRKSGAEAVVQRSRVRGILKGKGGGAAPWISCLKAPTSRWGTWFWPRAWAASIPKGWSSAR